MPRVYRKLRDAVREGRSLRADGPIRVGLAGLTTERTAVTKLLILPRPNIAAAARRIMQFAAGYDTNSAPRPRPNFLRRCRVLRLMGTVRLGLPDAVLTSATKDDALNFDMREGDPRRGPGCVARRDLSASDPLLHDRKPRQMMAAAPDGAVQYGEAGTFRQGVKPRSFRRSACRESAAALMASRRNFRHDADELRLL